MKNKFKVGDIIKANEMSNKRYGITCENNGFIGRVTHVDSDGNIDVQTLHRKDDGVKIVFLGLDPKFFDVIDKHEIHITTAMFDREYVVLEGYTPPEKEEEKKPEFIPHLSCDKENYGVIGEPTKYKDAIGRQLFIGDTVEHFSEDNQSFGETSIAKHNGKSFVMGIEVVCNDKNGKIEDGWKIIKKRSFEEVKDGETVNFIKYIKTEKGNLQTD